MKLIKYYKPNLEKIFMPNFEWEMWEKLRNKPMYTRQTCNMWSREDVIDAYNKDEIKARFPIQTSEYKKLINKNISTVLRLTNYKYMLLEKNRIILVDNDIPISQIFKEELTYKYYLFLKNGFKVIWDVTFFRDLRYIYGLNEDPSNEIYKYYLPNGIKEDETSIEYFWRMYNEKK